MEGSLIWAKSCSRGRMTLNAISGLSWERERVGDKRTVWCWCIRGMIYLFSCSSERGTSMFAVISW